MTNLELAQQQGNQAAPNVIDAAKASEVQIDITLAQEQGNQATPLIADSLAGSESYDAIKQQGTQAMPLIVDALEQPVPPTPTGNYMYFEAVEANSTVTLMSTLETAPNLEYSTDGTTWQEWQHTTAEDTHTFDTITLGAVGDRVYLRGNNPDGLAFFEDFENFRYSNFVLTGLVNGGGNVMSLLDSDMELTEVPQFGFMLLFSFTAGEGIEAALLTAPSMESITTIGVGGCAEMYETCTSLTTAAAMPALTTIGEEGCYNMYAGCTSLTAAADMPSLVTIGVVGCSYMYSGCASLTAAADMPALTAVYAYGCERMYYECTSLTATADMPSLVTIGEEGCSYMYSGCTSLTAAADMPALTTVSDAGCNGMYFGCTALTSAADMPSLVTIGNGGCLGMYYNCTFNMSDDGTTLNFEFPTPPVTAGETTYSTAYDVANWMGNTNGFLEPMYFEAVNANSTVTLMSLLETAPNLEYSTDGTTWQEWQHTTDEGMHTFDTLTLTAVGDRVYLRGDNPNGLAYLPEGADFPRASQFGLTGAVNGGGNVMSLLDSDVELTEVPPFGFAYLFAEAALLTAPSMGTITAIGSNGCYGMYEECTSLTASADMPALTAIGENGCADMYLNDTKLTAAADMPLLTSIGLEGCADMYGGCRFDMSDDGSTLNFDFTTPPVTAGQHIYSTAYDVAEWMGNINGFTNP